MKVTNTLKYFLVISFIFVFATFIYQYIFLPNKTLNSVDPCLPFNFKQIEKESTFYLTWETAKECSGYVKYGTTETDFPYIALDEQGVVKITDHSVKLSGIEKGDRYFFVVFSDEKNYGKNNQAMEITFY